MTTRGWSGNYLAKLFLRLQRFIALFDRLGLLGAEALQQIQQLPGVEGVELVVGPATRITERPVNNDHGYGGSEKLEGPDDLRAGHLRHFRIHHYPIHRGETA